MPLGCLARFARCRHAARPGRLENCRLGARSGRHGHRPGHRDRVAARRGVLPALLMVHWCAGIPPEPDGPRTTDHGLLYSVGMTRGLVLGSIVVVVACGYPPVPGLTGGREDAGAVVDAAAMVDAAAHVDAGADAVAPGCWMHRPRVQRRRLRVEGDAAYDDLRDGVRAERDPAAVRRQRVRPEQGSRAICARRAVWQLRQRPARQPDRGDRDGREWQLL